MRLLNFALTAAALTSLATHAQTKPTSTEKAKADKPKAAATQAASDAKPANTNTKTAAAEPAKAPAKPQEPQAVNFNSSDVWDVDIFKRDDHKVIVVQDRRYVKAKRFELGINGGIAKSSPFYNSFTYGVSADYYFNEYLGLELFWNKTNSSFSADGEQLQSFLTDNGFTAIKEFHKPDQIYGGALLWSPIYGKFAFFRRSIIHFDFFGSVGLSNYSFTSNKTSQGGRNQSKLGSLASLGVRVFLTKHFSLRIDGRHNAYQAYFAPTGPLDLTTNQPTGEASTLWRQNFQATLGTSFIF
jgi:outer membrane beta-barrel protein